MSPNRLSWPLYFMDIAELASRRSTCVRRQVGAVAVLDNRVIATGYNGVPSGMIHCDKIGCLRSEMKVPSGERHEICRGLHAEQNVIIQAATSGASMKGADIYTTCFPCSLCAKMLINCGVKRIFYREEYEDKLSRSIFKEAGISLIRHTTKNSLQMIQTT